MRVAPPRLPGRWLTRRSRRFVMRRFSALLSVIAAVLLGVLALQAQHVVVAQEATPGAGQMAPEGVTFEPVSFALGVDLASPSDLFLARVGIDPGAGFPIEETDPSLAILLVESGTLTV